jgi:hypothetical protein
VSFAPRALAEALALEDWDLFRSIPLMELLEVGWDSDRYQNNAQACVRLNTRYEALSLWVSAEVLCAGGERTSAAVLVRIIETATELRALNDFSGVFAFCTGLRREEVSRLGAVWALLPSRTRAQYDALAALTNDANKNKAYKGVFFSSAQPPSPYEGRCSSGALEGGGGRRRQRRRR